MVTVNGTIEGRWVDGQPVCEWQGGEYVAVAHSIWMLLEGDFGVITNKGLTSRVPSVGELVVLLQYRAECVEVDELKQCVVLRRLYDALEII